MLVMAMLLQGCGNMAMKQAASSGDSVRTEAVSAEEHSGGTLSGSEGGAGSALPEAEGGTGSGYPEADGGAGSTLPEAEGGTGSALPGAEGNAGGILSGEAGAAGEGVPSALPDEGEAALPAMNGSPEQGQATEPVPPDAGTAPAADSRNPGLVDRSSRNFHVVFNGDSRTVCLYCAQAYSEEEYPKHLFTHHLSETYSASVGNSTFVAKGGEGYYFFSTYGLALAATHFEEDSVLVVWFGVNDAEFVDQYIVYMNGASLQFGIPVYYMTLGPCCDTWTKREPGIEAMNEKLRTQLRPEIGVIDVFPFIQDGMNRGEFGTLDGLHYNYKTSRAIYDYVMAFLEAEYAAGKWQ